MKAQTPAHFVVCRAWRAMLLIALLLTGGGAMLPASAQSSSRFAGRNPGRNARSDFARLVVIGDSLSAGYQNNSLLRTQQVNGYASLVARQAKADLTLPLIAEPGVPNVLQLLSPGPPPVITPVAGTSAGRVNPMEQPFNLAVPGARLTDVLNTRPTMPVDSLTDLVLGFPDFFSGRSRTQIEIAESLQPTTVFVWIGNNDALGAALATNPVLLTSQASFAADYQTLLNRVAATNAKIVVANIPDVTVIPFFTPAPQVVALFGQTIASVGTRLGITENDLLTPQALPLIQAALTGGSMSPLPASVVLTAAEATQIQAAVVGFNNTIRRTAEATGAALADVNTLLNLVDRFGLPIIESRSGNERRNGRSLFNVRFLTTDFLGGLFSLDGVHPTDTGYAVVANEFIRAYDVRYKRLLPFVDVSRIAADDDLVLER
ncbi:MAG: SGNH/GDSL hydrolase family protein [Pyrinomonadaceae bacterium MAG19_C2-C3]|nr:SGNH/GDSL hydrolase family protein [Pyrinomonadaceae bacterium MAG19_C2-C3]